MRSAREQFGGLGDRVWLNCAHQGPLPDVAVAAAREALEQKRSPWLLEDGAFEAVPRRLRGALGRLVGAPAEEIILANSTSYGLELLVRNLPLDHGDEVVLVDGDFPATVYPWLPLRDRGVEVRIVRPKADAITAEEVAAELGPATRVFCSSWVFSFTGAAIDIDAIGAICRERGVTSVLNGSQAVGARPLDLQATDVDALVCAGFKWLCGPYGTGFAWMSPEVRESLTHRPAYWLTHQAAGAGGLERTPTYELANVGAAAYDVSGTANFLNYRPWTESIELLLKEGVDTVAEFDQSLVDRLLAGLADLPITVVSPREGPERSTLVYITHETEDGNELLHERLTAAGIEVAARAGALRLSPHFYNSKDDIDRALDAIAA